ncbi:MAG: type II methionyl aminopeptidase [Candidatus Bathyarchaeota archaeon]|nr:type II methionyl aminopeptidase [Candidatus Bathyarchaeota archaeon]
MGLPEDIFEKYEDAGKIAREVRERMRRFVRVGMPIIEVCEKAEGLIREKGGQLAFPCNVSINEIAAHYTSPPNDKSTIPPNSLVKVDIGAHLDGYIADTAVTICFNPEHENLMRAAQEALKVGVKTIYAGISTSKLGSAIQKTIKAYGCKPVSNLTGHQIGRYLIHTGKSLPNVAHIIGSKIREGEVVALEPFVTVANAAGKVKDGDETTIFRFVKRKPLQKAHAKRLLSYIEANFMTLPFSERWLNSVVPQENYVAAFQELLRSRCLTSYPIFIEASRKPVAQAEHTVLVVKNGCIVLT